MEMCLKSRSKVPLGPVTLIFRAETSTWTEEFNNKMDRNRRVRLSNTRKDGVLELQDRKFVQAGTSAASAPKRTYHFLGFAPCG